MQYERSALIWSLALTFLALVTCSEQPPTTLEDLSIQAAKPDGTGKPVKVEATDPSSAEQETIELDVRVLGSGFDDGSVATWLKEGDPAGVETHSTDYVSDEVLVANISVAADARIGFWDVEVMTLRGKKGIGIESFEVKEKTPPGQVEFDAYTQIDLGTLGRRKGTSRAHSVSDPFADGMMLVTGESQQTANSDLLPVIWEVTVTATDTSWIGPTPLPLPSPNFFSGRAGSKSLAGQFLVGWVFKSEYINGEPIANAVRWRYESGVNEVLTFEPYVHPTDPDVVFLASAGRGVNDLGDVVGNSSSNHAVFWDVDGDGEDEFGGSKIATFWDGVYGEATPLFTPLRGLSIAYAVNNQRYVVGYGQEVGYFNPGGELEGHAVLWLPDGTPCDLGVPGVSSEAFNLTDLGSASPTTFYVSGTSDSRGSVWEVEPHAPGADPPCTIVQQWTMDVESIVGGIRVVDGGWETVGRGQIITPGQDHPFAWRQDITGLTVTPLGEVGRAYIVNGSGSVAGYIPVKDLEHAVLWLPK
jgi:hypothetical protein